MSSIGTEQTTSPCKCHSLQSSSHTSRTDGKKMISFLCSNVETVPKSRLAHGTIGFATTREQVSMEPASTSQCKWCLMNLLQLSAARLSAAQAELGVDTGNQMQWICS